MNPYPLVKEIEDLELDEAHDDDKFKSTIIRRGAIEF